MADLAVVAMATLAALQLLVAPPKALAVTQPTIQTTTEKAQKALKAVTDGFDVEAATQLLNALYAEGVQSMKVELQGKSLFPDTANPVMGYLSQMASLETLQNELHLHRTLSKVYRVFVELTWFQAWQKRGKRTRIPVFPVTKDKAIQCSEDMIEILTKRGNASDAEFEYRMAQEAAKLLMPSESTWAKFLESAAIGLSEAATLDFEGIWKSLKAINNELDKEGVEKWYFNNFFLRWAFVNACNPQDLKTDGVRRIVRSSLRKCMREGREYAQGFLMALMDILENPKADPQLKEIALLGNDDLPGLIPLFEQDDQRAIVTFCDKMGMGALAQKLDRFRGVRLLAQCLLKKLATDPKFDAYKEKSCAALRKRSLWLHQQHAKRLQEEKLAVQASLEEINTQVTQSLPNYANR